MPRANRKLRYLTRQRALAVVARMRSRGNAGQEQAEASSVIREETMIHDLYLRAHVVVPGHGGCFAG